MCLRPVALDEGKILLQRADSKRLDHDPNRVRQTPPLYVATHSDLNIAEPLPKTARPDISLRHTKTQPRRAVGTCSGFEARINSLTTSVTVAGCCDHKKADVPDGGSQQV